MSTMSETSALHQQASFKRQLIRIFITSVIFLAIFTSVLTAWQTSETFRKNTIETGRQVTNNFAEQIVLALLTGSQENGQEAINRSLGFVSVIGVSVFNAEGGLLVSSTKDSQKHTALNFTELSQSAELLSETEDVWVFSAPVIYVDELYDDDLLDPSDEELQQQTLGYVLIEYDKQALQQIQQDIFINNIGTGIVVALILSLVIRVVINHMTQPLLALSQTMATARDSGLYPKASVKGAREVRQIAQTYNQMMTTLEQQNSALEKSRDTLESEVEVRTQELVVARDSALTASRHKSEFLANISHELRTPLQAIIGYTDLVREDLELECMDAQADDLGKSIRSANNLLALINNILDLAKIEAGRMDLYIKSVNIKNLVDESIETILPMAKANDNEIMVSFGSLSSILNVDRQKLMQIFLNLLSNACKFTKNGVITFEIHNDKHFLYFSVNDTGVGIAQEKLDFIFEQFTQVDGSQTRQYEGTGLGMAITQNFCQLMKGSLTVESELAVGSTFKVKLPLHKGD